MAITYTPRITLQAKAPGSDEWKTRHRFEHENAELAGGRITREDLIHKVQQRMSDWTSYQDGCQLRVHVRH